MIYLIDTNVLLGASHRADRRNSVVQAAVHKLWTNGFQLQTTPQNFAEFWNVSTRPVERNGFGLTPYETDELLQDLEQSFPLLSDSPKVYPKWRQLIVDYEVSGVKVHDARLVASMISHDVTHILTFNTADFTRYVNEGIVAVDPADV
ncbi:MAG: PIN domain-containing protein [Candidatus Poribacteria bacterium]|nr:PIN domain-containing protein [Candidatus Poribacteria bacterium]